MRGAPGFSRAPGERGLAGREQGVLDWVSRVLVEQWRGRTVKSCHARSAAGGGGGSRRRRRRRSSSIPPLALSLSPSSSDLISSTRSLS